jgi:hypothetical protein
MAHCLTALELAQSRAAATVTREENAALQATVAQHVEAALTLRGDVDALRAEVERLTVLLSAARSERDALLQLPAELAEIRRCLQERTRQVEEMRSEAPPSDTMLEALALELRNFKKYPFQTCTDVKVLGPLSYAECAALLATHPARSPVHEADGWLCIGRTTRRQLNGVDRTKRDCFLKSIRLDPTNSYAWNGLGSTMSAKEVVTVGGVDRTQRDCVGEAIRLDPTNFKAN